MATITSVSSAVVDIPLQSSAVFATRKVASRQFLLVKIQCDDGFEGIGATYCGDHGGEIYQEAVHSLLANVLIRRDPFASEALWREMYQESLLQGRAGAVFRSLAALDIALWDHNSKVAGLPLWKYLGTFYEGTVPAYASGGYYNDSDDIKKLCQEMERNVAMGFSAMKMKVGRKSVSEDRLRVAAAREVIGPDRLLMMDANNSWKSVPEAMQFLRAVAEYEPFWIEEPFGPDDIDNHSRLAKISPISIATGEIEAGHWRFRELLRNEAVNIPQPDVFACGGITEWRRIAHLADSFGMPVCTHAWQEFHAPLIASVANGLFVEFFTDERIVNLQRILDIDLAVEGGKIILPQNPGLGFEFKEKEVEKNTLVSWQEKKEAKF